MSLPAHEPVLYAWYCPICALGIRTRLYDHTQREARFHAWSTHRQAVVGAPHPVMWDVRIQGKRCLYTQPDNSES